MGASASSIQGITWAVRAVGHLQWIPPAVTTLHKRIARGSVSWTRAIPSPLWALYGPSMRALRAVYAPLYAPSMRPLCAHYAPSMRPLCALYAHRRRIVGA